ncbi:CO dehydrogenase/acetyl-CoA synthase gamma subunit (corrinoid Fe-S protein) [Bradyrhizobium sp. USDA 4449]
MRVKALVISATVLALATPAFAQGTQQKTNRSQAYTRPRTPVATQPGNNPFSNPIGQGVPPAVSARPNLNSNRTYVPR